MKLYFYVIKNEYGEPARMIYAECEAIEKEKTYKPADKFPNCFSGSYVRKNNIGEISGYKKNIVVLLEKKAKRAKEIFSNYYKEEIKLLEKEIAGKEKILSAVDAFEE